MANTITNLTTSNTFLQWLTASQSVISSLNSLREGGVANTYVVNTSIEIAGDLVVSGNLTLDAIGYDDLNVAGNTQLTGTLTVGGNTSLSNAYVTYGNFETANITNLTSDGGLLNASSNVFVNDWVFSANANVRPGITTFTVTNAGAGAYLFDQYPGNNPDIYLHPGQTVSFNINVSGHPFLIRQSAGGALYNVGLTHVSTTGVVTTEGGAQGKQTGTLIWKVPFSLVNNTYVYQCQVHSGMVGNLIIQNTVTSAYGVANSASIYANGAFTVANTAATDSLAFAIALG